MVDSNYRTIKTNLDPPGFALGLLQVARRTTSTLRAFRTQKPESTKKQKQTHPPAHTQNVLPTMPVTRITDTEAHESGPNGDPRDVHSTLPGGVLSGAEALHHLQPGVPHSHLTDMLQWRRQLHLLGQLRGTSV